MAGNSSITGNQTVTFTDNMSFDGTDRGGAMNADGQLWIGATASNRANDGGHVRLGTLTAGSGISITNGAGSITIANTGATTDLHVARYIVSAGGTTDGANYTTITSAIAAAASVGTVQTIFLQPGTYTENFTLPENINLAAFSCDALTPNVIILGKITCTTAGARSISGIQLKTNSDFCLSVTGTVATYVRLINCFVYANNNTAIQFTSTGTAKIELFYCKGDIGTTGIAYFAHSGTGKLLFVSCSFENNGSSSTASTNSSSTAGGVDFQGSYFNNAITTSNSAQINADNTQFPQPIIANGTTTGNISNSSLTGSTASAISIGAGATMGVYCSKIASTNTNAISGAGTINYSGLAYSDTSVTMNTTTQVPTYMDLGKYRARGQPAFYAYLAANASNVVGNSSTPYQVLWDTEAFDQGGNFASNTFTAPVAGRYYFTACVRLQELTELMTYGDIRIVVGGVTLLGASANIGVARTVSTTADTYCLVGSWFVNMAATDTAIIQIIVSGGAAASADIIGAQTGGSYFMGYLVA